MAIPLHTLIEDPNRTESAVLEEIERAKNDPAARFTLEATYLDEDRATAFDRFRQGLELERFLRLLGLLGVPRTSRICEVGAGPGFLAWGLSVSGYERVDVLEPNANFVTGTGYLRTRSDAASIRVFSDLAAWYERAEPYDLVITRNCVHHFRGLGMIAAGIRQRLAPGGRWLMMREWYAETPAEVYSLLQQHPYALKHRLYEFPHPVARYLDTITTVGFRVQAVVPARYANGVLADYVTERGGRALGIVTSLVDAALAAAPWLTVLALELERPFRRALPPKLRIFCRPQVVVFRKIPVAGWDDVATAACPEASAERHALRD